MVSVGKRTTEVITTKDVTPEKYQGLIDDINNTAMIGAVNPTLSAAQIGIKIFTGPTTFLLRILSNLSVFIAFLITLVILLLFGIPKLTGSFLKSLNPTNQQRIAQANYAMVNDSFSSVRGVDVDTVPLNKLETILGWNKKSEAMVYINVPKLKIDNPIFDDASPEAQESIKNALRNSISKDLETVTNKWQLKYDGKVIGPKELADSNTPPIINEVFSDVEDILKEKGYKKIDWIKKSDLKSKLEGINVDSTFNLNGKVKMYRGFSILHKSKYKIRITVKSENNSFKVISVKEDKVK
jgi:hypothetical protein